jgi:hypothetical protein
LLVLITAHGVNMASENPRGTLYGVLLGAPGDGKSLTMTRAMKTIMPSLDNIMSTTPGSDKGLYRMFSDGGKKGELPSRSEPSPTRLRLLPVRRFGSGREGRSVPQHQVRPQRLLHAEPAEPRYRHGPDHVLNIPKLRGYRSASDRDIDHRNLYLIDIDPVRPSGVASSPIELCNAKAVALNVREYLRAKGWPEPIQVSSGNGVHLLYKGEGPASDYYDWKNALKFLAHKFGTADAKIDTSAHNAARISRLPGCFNRKGEDTPERPHRMARVISYPSRFDVVPITKVRELTLGDQRLCPSKTTYTERELVIDEDGLRDLIESYPEVLCISKERTSGTQTMFGLAECPFVERGHRGQNVGVSKTVILIDPTKNKIGFNCLSDGCAEHTFGDLRKLLEERTG